MRAALGCTNSHPFTKMCLSMEHEQQERGSPRVETHWQRVSMARALETPQNTERIP